ncbi:hypothetical protein GCM10011571_24440 [Marinithermofilum abyssi]|uniref:Uncharacterized protein n=1 Tax=Marinithermofilum abyssi TaxID=1571185 RepID=A0A8J2VFK5_9BACL|nr:hypothetical protein [Marinithermofilum abyssi]GGE21473.1 hypothetical protein GCM10011571_24440 [Marinithermofilum abyssi]
MKKFITSIMIRSITVFVLCAFVFTSIFPLGSINQAEASPTLNPPELNPPELNPPDIQSPEIKPTVPDKNSPEKDKKDEKNKKDKKKSPKKTETEPSKKEKGFSGFLSEVKDWFARKGKYIKDTAVAAKNEIKAGIKSEVEYAVTNPIGWWFWDDLKSGVTGTDNKTGDKLGLLDRADRFISGIPIGVGKGYKYGSKGLKFGSKVLSKVDDFAIGLACAQKKKMDSDDDSNGCSISQKSNSNGKDKPKTITVDNKDYNLFGNNPVPKYKKGKLSRINTDMPGGRKKAESIFKQYSQGNKVEVETRGNTTFKIIYDKNGNRIMQLRLRSDGKTNLDVWKNGVYEDIHF